ncbi:unnamed protein product [Closterium sp. NIES-53]
MTAPQLHEAVRYVSVMYADDSSVDDFAYYSSFSSLGAVEVASAFPASVGCPGPTTEAASLSFTLESRAYSCFFCDRIDLIPLRTFVTIALADPSVRPVVAHSTTTLLCPAGPYRVLTGYYTPWLIRNMVGVSHLYDLGLVTTFHLELSAASCTVGTTGAPLATFHKEPGSSLYSLHIGSHHIGSSQVRSGQVAAVSCDCRSITHPSVLCHHSLHHPSFPRLSRMAHYRLVSGLLASLAPLPRSPAPLCTPRCPSLLLVPPHHGSLPDPALGRLGPLPGPWPTSGALIPDCGGQLLPLHHGFPLAMEGRRAYRPRAVATSKGWCPGPVGAPTTVRPWCPPSLPGTPHVSRPAPSGVSHVSPQSSPPQRPIPVVSAGAGGAVSEGEGTEAVGASGVGSGGAGGVGVEVTPVEDTTASSQWPRPASPPGFLSFPQFPPRSSLRPVVAEPGGVPAGVTGGSGGVGGGGVGSGVAGAGGTGTMAPTSRTVLFLTLVEESQQQQERAEEGSRLQQQKQLQPQQERVEEESRVQQRVQLQSQQEIVEESWPHQERVEQESHPQQQMQLQTQQERVEEESRPQHERVAQESRSQQRVQLQPQQERAEEEPQEQKQGQVPSQQTPEEAEQHDYATCLTLHLHAWFVVPYHPLLFPPSIPFPCPSGLVVLPSVVLCLQSPLSLTVLHNPLSDYLRASCPVVSRVLSALVTHPTAPLSSVSALVTTVAGFASSHRLDHPAHLVCGPSRSPSSGGALVFPVEVLEDRQIDLGFPVAAILMRFCFLFSKVQLTPLAVDHGLMDAPLDESFESCGPYSALVGCLMYLMTCNRPDLAYPLSVLARFVAPGRHRPSHWYAAKRVAKFVASTSSMGLVLGGKQPVTLAGYSFSLGSGGVSWRSTRASFVSGSSCEADVYAVAMAAQELRWRSSLLTDLGERPRSPPVLFAANSIRRVVSEAITPNIFTKALPPCDHQRFCSQLGLVPARPHLLT